MIPAKIIELIRALIDKSKSNKVFEKEEPKVSSVADKAAEIKRKLAEKKATKSNVDSEPEKKATKSNVKSTVDDFDPFANNNGASSKKESNPFEEEESNDLVDKVVKGKKYKYDPKTHELWTDDFTLVGKFNPKLKSQIEEIEA
jgi:NADP-dependent 3-hydroxy acid dehydrogenase YdfG